MKTRPWTRPDSNARAPLVRCIVAAVTPGYTDFMAK